MTFASTWAHGPLRPTNPTPTGRSCGSKAPVWSSVEERYVVLRDSLQRIPVAISAVEGGDDRKNTFSVTHPSGEVTAVTVYLAPPVGNRAPAVLSIVADWTIDMVVL